MRRKKAPKTAVSTETLARVDAACARSGLGSWEDVARRAHTGELFNVEFAGRRSVDFVKEFAALLRSNELVLRADSSLEVLLGESAALEHAIASGRRVQATALDGLGEVDEANAERVELSGVRRSAGITYLRREPKRPLAGCSVVVLDDDDVSRRVLAALLRDAGCDVRMAADAESAFALLRASRPDIVVLDIVLGGAIDGFGFCRAMRASEHCSAVPAIFVTGYPGPEARREALTIPASAYFEKPVKSAQLSSAIAALSGSMSTMQAA